MGFVQGDLQLRDNAGILQKSANGGLTWGDVGSRSGLISGGSNWTSVLAAAAQANALGGGYTIELGRGTYRVTSLFDALANGIALVGNGPGQTFLELDDAGGLAGANAIRVNQVLQFALKGMSITATTARTAGAFLQIKGKNNITATPAQRTRQYTVEDVDAEDQFDGVSIVNGDTGDGAWGGFINRCEWLRFSAGGTYVDINSTAGGQHYISNLKMYGSHSLSNAQRALAGIRYRGGADLEMVNVNQVYMRSGFLWDPPNGQAANVVVATACLWDNNTLASILIQPGATGTAMMGEFMGGWGYTPAANTQPTVQIDGGRHISFIGGKYLGCYQAFRLSGGAGLRHILVQNANCSGSIAGLYATLNASDFQFLNNIVGIEGVTPTVGIQIDAGCDRYAVIGNNVRECTTPITNTPGHSAGRRIVTDMNVIL